MNNTIITNPATGEKIGEFPVHTREDVFSMIEQARKMQPVWGKQPVRQRVKKIMKIRDYLISHVEELSLVLSEDNGKTIVEALASEILPAVMSITYYCKKAKKFLRTKHIPTSNILLFNKNSFLRREPFGVIGIISPWNYPFAIPFSEVIMGLLAGNAVVLKTASETQAIGHLLKEAIEFAGLPEYIFQYANIPGAQAGDAFIDAKVDKLFFTGSTGVGKYLMEKASKYLIPLSLELGGNDPMLVLEDANIDRAVYGALWAGFQNAGQSCGGVERIYVHQSIYDNFVKKLSQKVKNLKIGIGQDFDSQMGVMTTEKQKNKVMEHLEDALAKGAKISAESGLSEELASKSKTCCKAYVLTNVNHNMLTMREETFGPIVGIMPFSDYEEAIKLANDSDLGLTASVWSKNRGKARKLAERIKAGAITINDHLMSHGMAETPWGGFKESGLGRTHSRLGFDEMTQPQIIIDDRLSFAVKNLWWHPYNKGVYQGLLSGLYVLYHKNIGKKIKSVFKLGKVFFRIFKK